MASESETTKGTVSIVHTFLGFIPAELRDMVGFFTGFILVFAVPVAVVMGVITLYHLMQKSKQSNVACWHVQVIENRAFKLNSCTGELLELAPPSASELKVPGSK